MDGNFVLTESGKILEIQMTAEDKPYDAARLQDLLKLADKGIKEIIELQLQSLSTRP
jgi:ribonuclease PH